MDRLLKPLKWYKDLNSHKGRIEAGVFLIEGDRAVKQLTGYYPQEIIEILTIPELASRYRNFPVRVLTSGQISSISSAQTPQGIISVVRIPSGTNSDQLPEKIGSRILLLEDVQDPGNVGTIIRTASAFNYSGIIMSLKCADPFSPKVVQSAAGSILAPWIRRTNSYFHMLKTLLEKKYILVAADLRGKENLSGLTEEKLVLGLGNEASGLTDRVLNVANYKIKIPVNKEKSESLNVAIAGGILMYLSQCSTV